MERVVALGRKVLPRGWRDFGLQLSIWFGFYFTYLAVRHLTDQRPDQGARERAPRDLARAAPEPSPLRAERGADRRLVVDAADGCGLDVLELGVHRDRPDPALGLSPPARGLQSVPQHDPARERRRSPRLLADADRAAVDVPRQGIRRRRQPLERAPADSRKLVRRDAEPARGGRTDRRLVPRDHLPDDLGEGALGLLAGLGLVLRHRDGESLRPRRTRRDRRGGRGAARHGLGAAALRTPRAASARPSQTCYSRP